MSRHNMWDVFAVVIAANAAIHRELIQSTHLDWMPDQVRHDEIDVQKDIIPTDTAPHFGGGRISWPHNFGAS